MPWRGGRRLPAWWARADAWLSAPARDISRTSSAAAQNNFNALRIIAALLVVCGHEGTDATGTFGLRLVLFFAISGFLIAGSWQSDPHAVRFLQRRFLRVWPAYAVVIVVCAALSYLFPAPDMPEISRLASLFYLSNLWFAGFDWGFFAAHNPFMNQSIWMMRYEVDIYIAFALIALCGRRVLMVAAVVVLLAATRSTETRPEVGGLLECWSLYFGGFFAFGVLLRLLPRLRDGAITLGFVAVGAVLLTLGARTAGLLLVIAPAAVWIGHQSWPVLRSATRFGDLSLGVFLWAWPVHQVTALWMPRGTPALLAFAAVLLQVLVLAWLSWHLVEARALRLKPRKPRDPAAAPSLF